jgi:hypothetical protein
MKEKPQETTRSSPEADPLRLAGVTIRAVDQIGAVAAEEIERAADELGRRSNEIINDVRKLADSIRSHTKATRDRVSDFCDKATSIVEGVRELQEKLRPGEPGSQQEQTAEIELPLPKAARQGLGNGHDPLPDRLPGRVAHPANVPR